MYIRIKNINFYTYIIKFYHVAEAAILATKQNSMEIENGNLLCKALCARNRKNAKHILRSNMLFWSNAQNKKLYCDIGY